MYNNDVGKGGVYAYEAYEVKKRVAAFRAPIYFINLLPTSLLYISILLIESEEERAAREEDGMAALMMMPFICSCRNKK
jgi:hypothetical protein